MTKIVTISDTHTHHRKVELPEGDILIHAGDFTSRGRGNEVIDFFYWLETQSEKFKHIIFIAGNHDLSFENKYEWLLKEIDGLPSNVHYLEDSEIVIDGIKFYGTPWQPEFHQWAFNLPRGPKLAEKWALIPNDTDVLITHGPPATVLDFVLRYRVNVGCIDLLYRIEEVKPKLNVFGHIHEGYGIKNAPHTTFINASVCTTNYYPDNKPRVFEM
jgi:Icc-related predicted phosphoesterase